MNYTQHQIGNSGTRCCWVWVRAGNLWRLQLQLLVLSRMRLDKTQLHTVCISMEKGLLLVKSMTQHFSWRGGKHRMKRITLLRKLGKQQTQHSVILMIQQILLRWLSEHPKQNLEPSVVINGSVRNCPGYLMDRGNH